jgi:hypothetical protein
MSYLVTLVSQSSMTPRVFSLNCCEGLGFIQTLTPLSLFYSIKKILFVSKGCQNLDKYCFIDVRNYRAQKNLICFSKEKEKINLKWIEFSYQGIPYIVQVIWKDVEAGEELLTSYGEAYDFMRNHRKGSKNHI